MKRGTFSFANMELFYFFWVYVSKKKRRTVCLSLVLCASYIVVMLVTQPRTEIKTKNIYWTGGFKIKPQSKR